MLSEMEIWLRDLREMGWMVAVHNDYRIGHDYFTFWLFTKGPYCVKGEGATDLDALRQCAKKASELEDTARKVRR